LIDSLIKIDEIENELEVMISWLIDLSDELKFVDLKTSTWITYGT